MKAKIKANKIRYYRRLLNWTQEQLAEAVGSRYQYIGRYERGVNRIPEKLKPKIASVLGLPQEVVFPEDTGLPLRGVLNEKTENRPI